MSSGGFSRFDDVEAAAASISTGKAVGDESRDSGVSEADVDSAMVDLVQKFLNAFHVVNLTRLDVPPPRPI